MGLIHYKGLFNIIHSWSRCGNLSLDIKQFGQGVTFQILARRLKVVLRQACHDPVGPNIGNESTELETIEEISAEVVVHIDIIREESEECDIYVWGGLTDMLRAMGIIQVLRALDSLTTLVSIC